MYSDLSTNSDFTEYYKRKRECQPPKENRLFGLYSLKCDPQILDILGLSEIGTDSKEDKDNEIKQVMPGELTKEHAISIVWIITQSDIDK